MGASSDFSKDEKGLMKIEKIDKSNRKYKKYIGNSLAEFEIIVKLGEGRFGLVYKVKSKITQCLYAMKEIKIKNNNDKDIRKEIKLLEELNHSHVVNYFTSFIENGFCYIVVEYMNGGNLQDLINKNIDEKKFMEEKKIWEYLIQCLSGLFYLHNKKKIIHRDIKPDNLMLDKDNYLKISDFGISAVDSISADETIKFHKSIIGPLHFFAPEVLTKGYDFKSDIFMLGLTSFLLSSNKYYLRRKLAENKKVEITETNERIPNIYSDILKQFIYSMLQQPKDKRPTSEQALNDALYIYNFKYLKATSIMSLFFCFFSSTEIVQCFMSQEILYPIVNENQDNKYMYTKKFVEILYFANTKNFTFGQMEHNCLELRYLCDKEKKDINKSKEIDLLDIIIFLFAKMNKELHIEEENNNESLDNSSNRETIDQANEESVMDNMIYKWKKSFSKISDEYFYMEKIARQCLTCNNFINYEGNIKCIFSMYPDSIARSFKKPDINMIDLFEYFKKKRKYGDKKIYCKNCLKYQEKFYESKILYTCPPNFILHLKYEQYNFNLMIQETIDIKDFVEQQEYCNTKYILTGAIFFESNDDDEKIFSSISKNINNEWIYFNGKEIKPSSFNDIQQHKNIQYLFYANS